MGLLLGTRRALVGGGAQSYIRKVLGYNPIAYWPLWETSGSVARCLVNPAQNGTYTGATLGQQGIGDGNTAPLFDGVNDYVDIHTAALDAAFDGDEGSAMIWVFPSGGVWPAGESHSMCFNLFEDVNNRCRIHAEGGTGDMQFRRNASGTAKIITHATGAEPIAWHSTLLTWSLSTGVDGQLIAYWDGVQTGAIQTGIDAYLGSLSAVNTLIGAYSNAPPSLVWPGRLAHCVIFGRALSQPSIADLAVV